MLNIRTVTLYVVLVFSLALGLAPVMAAPGVHDQGSLAVGRSGAVGAPSGCETPHALGVEGGFLSLLNAREGSSPVAEIMSNQVYSLRVVRTREPIYVAYVLTTCS